MTEHQIRACFRLGVQVFLRSERTGRVWEIKPCIAPSDRHWGSPIDQRYAGTLTHRQVEWHLQNKPHNFSTTHE